MNDIMVDIETTGVQPDRANIIQLAAVKFNFETGEVDPNVFNRCLIDLPWRHWEEGTRDFWFGKNLAVLQTIYQRREPARKVFEDFIQWVGFDGEVKHMWAKPITFEWPFIASYLADFDLPSPFHYREARDCRSFMEGMQYVAGRTVIPDKDIPFDGSEHDAIFDVLHQIKWLLVNKEAAFHVPS